MSEETTELRINTLEQRVERNSRTLYGNGTEGLITKVSKLTEVAEKHLPSVEAKLDKLIWLSFGICISIIAFLVDKVFFHGV